MIYYWDKKLKKMHILEADIITINKNIDLVSQAQNMHFSGFVPNGHHCAYLSNKSLSY